MISDGLPKDDIRTIIENKEQYRALREIKAANALAKMGEYAPSFGMIGTLFGLIFMLAGMAMPPVPGVDPTAALISNMAIALITTLYGALFAFFFFLTRRLLSRTNLSTQWEPGREIAMRRSPKRRIMGVDRIQHPSNPSPVAVMCQGLFVVAYWASRCKARRERKYFQGNHTLPCKKR